MFWSLAAGCQIAREGGSSAATTAPSPSPAVRLSERFGSPVPAITATPTPAPPPPPTRTPVPSPAANPVIVPAGPTFPAKLHHQEASDEPRHVFATKFAELAEARTNGRMKVEVIPLGQFYSGPGEYQALRTNEIQFSLPRLAELATYDPTWHVLDLPFLLSPAAAAKLGQSAVGKSLWQGLPQRRISGLGIIDLQDPVILYTKDKPIRSLEDLAGLRVRTYLATATIHDEWLRLFGASAVSLPTAEVYAALQRGQVDAVLTTVSAATELRLPEVVEYGNLIPVSAVPMGFATNTIWFNDLPRPIQQVLTDEVIPEATRYLETYLDGFVADRRARAHQDGLEFVEVPPDLVATMKQRTEAELYPKYQDQFPGYLIRQIQELQ